MQSTSIEAVKVEQTLARFPTISALPIIERHRSAIDRTIAANAWQEVINGLRNAAMQTLQGQE